jgi:hypothetical protein
MMKTLRIRGLLLLLVSMAIVSCSDKKTADPQAKVLGNVDVKDLYCNPGKRSVSLTVPVTFVAPITVDGTLTLSKVCWVGIFENLAIGDDVGPFIDGRDWIFQQSSEFLFSVDLEEGNYMVVIGITDLLSNKYNISEASEKHGPYRTAAGGPDCASPRMSVEVQYDCMQGYDTRYGYALVDRLNTAFGGAGRTDITVSSDQVNLPAQVFSNIQSVNDWTNSNWWSAYFSHQTTAVLYLAGTKDAFPRANFYGTGDLGPDVAAVYFAPPGGSIGDPGGYCVVFRDWFNYTFYTDDVKEAVLRNGTHEMGHMRADLTDVFGDTTGHQEGFQCVMDALKTDASGNLVTGYQWFCAYCMSKIISVTW